MKRLHGPVAQRTEQVPSKNEMEVRFFPGSQELYFDIIADVAELADAQASEACGL